MTIYLWEPEQCSLLHKILFELKEHPTIEELAKKVGMPEEAVEIVVGGGIDLKHLEMKDNRIYSTPRGEEFYKSMKKLERNQNYDPTKYYMA